MRASRAVVPLVLTAAALIMACDNPPGGTTPTPIDPPQLSCPANVTVTGASGSMAVAYTAPILKGGTPPVTVTCAPVSGATFAIGTTAVTCSARDNVARTAACTFSVTLTARTLGAVRFMAFGDSLTAGENGFNDAPPGFGFDAPASQACLASQSTSAFSQSGARPQYIDLPHSYPTDLQNALSAQFPSQSIQVINEGLPGEAAFTAATPPPQGTGRFACALNLDQPDAVLLLEGINDLLTVDGSDAQEAAIGKKIVPSLASDISATYARGVRNVFVASLLPTNGNCQNFSPCRGASVQTSVITDANVQISAMVRSLGAVYVDAFGAFVRQDPNLTTLLDSDGLHATPAGYTALAQTFQTAILATIPQTTGMRGPGLNVLAAPKRR